MNGSSRKRQQSEPIAPVTAADIARHTAPLTEQFEGFSSTPYQDPAGVWTIGYGSTRDMLGQPITAATPPISRAYAEALLTRDLGAAVAAVRDVVKVPLTAHQWEALSDFVYNEGIGHFARSTTLKLLNQRQYAEAATHLEAWDIAGGRVLAGLLRRRQAEEKLFDTPDSKNRS